MTRPLLWSGPSPSMQSFFQSTSSGDYAGRTALGLFDFQPQSPEWCPFSARLVPYWFCSVAFLACSGDVLVFAFFTAAASRPTACHHVAPWICKQPNELVLTAPACPCCWCSCCLTSIFVPFSLLITSVVSIAPGSFRYVPAFTSLLCCVLSMR